MEVRQDGKRTVARKATPTSWDAAESFDAASMERLSRIEENALTAMRASVSVLAVLPLLGLMTLLHFTFASTHFHIHTVTIRTLWDAALIFLGLDVVAMCERPQASILSAPHEPPNSVPAKARTLSFHAGCYFPVPDL